MSTPSSPGSCESCGAALRQALPQVPDPESGESFSLWRCEGCGLGQTWPIPDDLTAYYGPRYHGARHGPTERLALWRRVRWAAQVTNGAPGSVLDMGCGDGTFLLAMQRRGWRAAGTELNPVRARAAGLPVVERVEDAATLGAPFQLITLWHSLEHFRHPRRTLERARTLLADDGVLLIAVPNADGLQARLFGPRWLHLDVPRHLFHFGPRSLDRLLGTLGFQVLRRWDEELEYDLLGWVQSALDTAGGAPRLLFDTLRGRPASSAWSRAAHLVAGGCLTPPALLATWASAAAGQGGTLVVAAQKSAAPASGLD